MRRNTFSDATFSSQPFSFLVGMPLTILPSIYLQVLPVDPAVLKGMFVFSMCVDVNINDDSQLIGTAETCDCIDSS